MGWLRDKLDAWCRSRQFNKATGKKKRMLFSRMRMQDSTLFISNSNLGSITVDTNSSTGSTNVMMTDPDRPRPEPPKDERIEVNPTEVVALLETDVDIPLDDMEEKLDKLRERALFYSTTLHQSVPAEIGHAITLLEARKQYTKLQAHIPWRTTTKEKIDALCKKYRLEHHDIDRYIPELPEYVVEEVERFKGVFEKAVKKVRHTDPEMKLSLIAKPELFTKRPKGDPILLARSPFGPFFYVLCAWDEEVNFVGDLLGGGMTHDIVDLADDEHTGDNESSDG